MGKIDGKPGVEIRKQQHSLQIIYNIQKGELKSLTAILMQVAKMCGGPCSLPAMSVEMLLHFMQIYFDDG